MSLWSRIANVFRGDRLSREIDEELQSHIEEAIEQGRDPAEARRAFGSALRLREESRDVRLIAWLDSLRADAVFGWRQLMKNKVTSAAAILSLALWRSVRAPRPSGSSTPCCCGLCRWPSRSSCTLLLVRESVPMASFKPSTAGRIRTSSGCAPRRRIKPS